MFADQADSASARQRASASRWQSLDRFYEQVQAAAADEGDASDEALLVMADLQAMAAPLTADVQLWRGIRNLDETFGAGLDQLVGREPEITTRFLSTTVHEGLARSEFTQPGPAPAILKVTARAGTRAVWMPSAGDPSLAYQGELLFQPGTLLRILRIDPSADVPVIEVEVSRP